MSKNLDDRTTKFIKKTYEEERFKINPTGYFYDLEIIKENIHNIEKTAPKQLQLFYAMKANTNSKIMQTVRNEKYISGVEIASSGELEKALKLYSNDEIIYTGPGKTEYE